MGQTVGLDKQWDKLPVGQNDNGTNCRMGQTNNRTKCQFGKNNNGTNCRLGLTVVRTVIRDKLKMVDCRLGQSNNRTGTNCRCDKMAMGQTANEAKWCQSVVVDGIWLSEQTCIDICKSVIGSLPFSYLFVVLSCLFVVVV